MGTIKRLVFLAGVVISLLGMMFLLDPVAVAAGAHNCGTALSPKQVVVPEVAERCETRINRRRWLGAGIAVVGALALVLPGPRCLMVDD